MFIVVEGIDFSGKTTFINLLINTLKSMGYGVTETREPGGGPIGEKVREILVSEVANKPQDRDVWGLLLAATRIENGRSIIKPALKRGDIVVSSRYVMSTAVYQKEAIPFLKDLCKKHPDIVEPDLMIVCDAPIPVILDRKKKRELENPGDNDHMDELFVKDYPAQRKEFLAMAHRLGDMAYVFDTSLPMEQQGNNLVYILKQIGLLKVRA